MLIALVALILMNRIYTKLKDEEEKLLSGPNFMNVPELSGILIEEYRMSHPKTKKSTFLWYMVHKSYDIEYEPEFYEILYLE